MLVAATLAGSVALAPRAGAQAAPVAAATPAAPAQPTIPSEDVAVISPELAAVRVDSARYRAAADALATTQVGLANAQRTRLESQAQLVALRATDDQLTMQIAADTARKKKAAARLAEIRAAMRDLAVANYINGGNNLDDLTAAVNAEVATAVGRQKVLTRAVNTSQQADEATTSARYDDAVNDIGLGVDLRDGIRARIAAVTAVHDQAAMDEANLGAKLLVDQVEVEQSRAMAPVVGADFPLVVMDAYFRAAQTMADVQPSCGIQWWAVAGIAKVEGRHGTYGGSTVLANGDTTRRIIGIPLNGLNDTAVIADSDGGRLDGDPSVDRAVGPMQFIPSTWSRWATDGNGDGIEDPHNLYDAARTAARYLCQSGPGLDEDGGLTRAFLSYNRSDPYAANVLSWAHTYARIVIPPVGEVVQN